MSLLGVILAGGRSRRFGSNKLLREVGGEPMVVRVARALVEAGAEEVVVSTRRELASSLASVLPRALLVLDREEECRGPARGLLAVFDEIEADAYLIAPGDAPWLAAGPLSALASLAASRGAEAASPLWAGGALEPLIAYAERRAAERFSALARARKGLCRPTDLHRAARRLLLAGTGLLSEDPRTFANVNRPEDLEDPKPRSELWRGVLELSGRHSDLFSEASLALPEDPRRASELYSLEASIYLGAGARHLAYHALLDSSLLSTEARGGLLADLEREFGKEEGAC
ncbi:MAG: molybdenum cofactor guanylyltransferase [Fervidicoccaceae archaeon]